MPPHRTTSAASTPKATQTRTKSSAKATPAKTSSAKATPAKTSSVKAASVKTSAKGGGKGAKSSAPVTPIPAAPPKRQTCAGNKNTAKVKIEQELLDEEAMEDHEDEDEDEITGEGEDEGDDVEERSAENTHSAEESIAEESTAEESAVEDFIAEEPVFLPPKTPKTKCIVHSEATSPPSSQKSPSPAKRTVKIVAPQPQAKATTRIIRKPTPHQRTVKRECSEDKYEPEEEDASPIKKTRQISPEPEVKEVTISKAQKSKNQLVLPRRQTLKAKADAQKNAPEKVQRTPAKTCASIKSTSKGKVAKPESTSSAAAVFGDEQMSEEE
ncbi:hypothetical protein LXA43DRAFT_1096458 [Ganoderma leucocontextum]|nr:hypothetical protein LXA43DRAFT_1096458 [Ganoderma leucocontextum]